MIELINLSVTYKSRGRESLALHSIDLRLHKGDICALIGPSGCGKSTLLHVLSGIISDYKGMALIDGKAVNPKEHRIGFIPQNYGLLEWASVYANAVLGLEAKGGIRKEDRDYIDYILSELGLLHIVSKYPRELSGGQRQRVSIARAFILKPDILLMDEPFSALDAITREEIQCLFLDTWRKNIVTTLFVTHSIEEAVYVGRKIGVMSPGPGRILRTIENPLFAEEDMRFKNDYYLFTSALRKLVKEEWFKC